MPKNSQGRDVAEIIYDKCIGCQLCAAECPVDAIKTEGGVVKIDPELCIGCGRCADVCPAGSVLFEKTRKIRTTGAGQKALPLSDFKGIAVFIETREGRGTEVSWELMGKARELADKLDTKVFGFLLGGGMGAAADEAIAYGCDTVYAIEGQLYQQYMTKTYSRALVHLCEMVRPEMMLVGATPLGRDLASVVATQLGTGLTADCTELDIDLQERLLLMTRPTFGGNILATILCRSHRPQMSTVRPRVLKLPQKNLSRKGEVHMVAFEAAEGALPRIVGLEARAAEEVDITRAPVLVVVGKGACDAKHLPMLEKLARLLGGAVACSRPVVAAGLLPYARQVGQTGKTVAPRVYIGVAVSGAVQHLVGMQSSERIVAINTDRNAPMVQMADYALIGDYREIVPKLIERIQSTVKTS